MSADIPAEVLELCSGLDGCDAEVTDNRCTVDFHGVQLRFVRSVTGWVFDEIVGDCWLHVEQMDGSTYWMGVHPHGAQSDRRVCVDIGARRAAVTMKGWAE